MKVVCVSLLAVALCACSRQGVQPETDAGAATSAPPLKVAASNPPAVNQSNPPAQKGPSTLETAVDGFTGRTAVNSGRKAQDKIRGVVRDRDADMKEVESLGR